MKGEDAVRDEHETELLAVDGVVSVGIADGPDDHPAIEVRFRDDPDDDAVPDAIEGVPVVTASVGAMELHGTTDIRAPGPRTDETADEDDEPSPGDVWSGYVEAYTRWVLPVLAAGLVVFAVASANVGAVGAVLAVAAFVVTLLMR